MFFMGVVVNVKAKDKNSLILTSDTFVPAEVVHSSTHIIHPTVEQQREDRRTLESAIGSNDGARPRNELESPGVSSVPRSRGRGVRPRSELESPGVSNVPRGRGRGNQ